MNLIKRMELLLDDPEHDGADSLVLPFADLRALVELVKAADAVAIPQLLDDGRKFYLDAYRKLREGTT